MEDAPQSELLPQHSPPIEPGPIAPASDPKAVWNWLDLGVLAGLALPLIVILAGLLAGVAKVFHLSDRDPIVALSAQALLYLLLAGALALILRVNHDAPFWRSLGFVRTNTWPIAYLALGFVLALTIATIGGMLHLGTSDSDILKMLHNPRGVLVLPIFAVTVAPLFEEMFFRGFLQPLLIRTLGVIAGIALTSAAFGVLHLQEYGHSWGTAALIALTGVALGTVRQVSGSTLASALVHAGYNGTLFIALFASGAKV